MNASRTERVVIVGGAIVGSFCAWELRRSGHTGPITVIDKDMSYERSSTALSAASIRTQFGTPTCIAMSLYAVELFRDLARQLGEANAHIDYVEAGYLILAAPDRISERTAAAEMQRTHGADVAAFTHDGECLVVFLHGLERATSVLGSGAEGVDAERETAGRDGRDLRRGLDAGVDPEGGDGHRGEGKSGEVLGHGVRVRS